MRNRWLFSPGTIACTPAALAVIRKHDVKLVRLLNRHLHGDWGSVPADDAKENNFARGKHLRILSSYPVADDAIWILTEADRSVTTFLLPSDY